MSEKVASRGSCVGSDFRAVLVFGTTNGPVLQRVGSRGAARGVSAFCKAGPFTVPSAGAARGSLFAWLLRSGLFLMETWPWSVEELFYYGEGSREQISRQTMMAINSTHKRASPLRPLLLRAALLAAAFVAAAAAADAQECPAVDLLETECALQGRADEMDEALCDLREGVGLIKEDIADIKGDAGTMKERLRTLADVMQEVKLVLKTVLKGPLSDCAVTPAPPLSTPRPPPFTAAPPTPPTPSNAPLTPLSPSTSPSTAPTAPSVPPSTAASRHSDLGKGAALLKAAWRGSEAEVRHLLDDGARVDARDPNGWTALHYAAWYGHAAVLRLLLARGAQVDARRNSGATPLHSAASNGRAESVSALLQARADPGAADEDGWTPLHYAALNGKEAAARLLVDAGAPRDAKNKDGNTPLDYPTTDALRRLLSG